MFLSPDVHAAVFLHLFVLQQFDVSFTGSGGMASVQGTENQ